MANQLVLIGGGHAHMMVLADIANLVKEGYAVTVIQPSEYHYYSGMGPGMLGGTYKPSEIRFATRRVVEEQGGRFVLGRATRIDHGRQVVLVDAEREVPYDVLSCNAGSHVPRDMITTQQDPDIVTVKPIEGLLAARVRLLERCRQQRQVQVAVVGGGPSSVEIAGNVHQLGQEAGLHAPVIRLFAGRRLLAHLPTRIRDLAVKMLTARGVEILEGQYVERLGSGRVGLANGREYPADMIFPAVGVRPPPIFAESGLPVGPDGGLLVNRHLQSPAHANIFGGGDCIAFAPKPLDKVGVYAVRQNPILLHNLRASLAGMPLRAFEPGGSYLLIYNLGGGEGIFCKWSILFSGRLAFRIKDYIDRKFMEKFQALERGI